MKKGVITKSMNRPHAIVVIPLKHDTFDLNATDEVSCVQVCDSNGKYLEYSYVLYANRAKIRTYEEMVAALVDLKYSTADEISLMRKGIADPQNVEHVAYMEYVNACKDYARKMYGIEVNA